MFNLLSKTNVNDDLCHHTISADLLIKYINNLSEEDKRYIIKNTALSINNELKTTDINKYFCKRCHRPITDIESIRLGMGHMCYKKWLKENIKSYPKKLF